MYKVNLLLLGILVILLSVSSAVKTTRQWDGNHPSPRHSHEFFQQSKGNSQIGNKFIDPYTKDLTTRPVTLKYYADNNQVYGLELVTENKRGVYSNPFHGVTKGRPQEFNFPKDQEIDHIILWFDEHTFKGLQIVFEDESSSPQIGGYSPEHIYYTIEGRLIGFFGTAQDKITSLGLICNKQETSTETSSSETSESSESSSSSSSESSSGSSSTTEGEGSGSSSLGTTGTSSSDDSSSYY